MLVLTDAVGPGGSFDKHKGWRLGVSILAIKKSDRVTTFKTRTFARRVLMFLRDTPRTLPEARILVGVC